MADNTDMKARIQADLDKAKNRRRLRSERIRDILREAVSQAVGELKKAPESYGCSSRRCRHRG